MDYLNRKANRLQGCDYSQTGAYFITICTQNKECILWERRGAQCAPEKNISLSEYGKMAERAIVNISRVYPAISLEKYVVMPNHVHLILLIQNEFNANGSTLCSRGFGRYLPSGKCKIKSSRRCHTAYCFILFAFFLFALRFCADLRQNEAQRPYEQTCEARAHNQVRIARCD